MSRVYQMRSMGSRILWAFACLSGIVLTGVGGIASAGAAAGVRSIYVMDVENEGHEYRVAINGVNVIGEQPVSRKDVEPFLRHGENRIEISFRRDPGWHQREKTPKFDVRLVKEQFPMQPVKEQVPSGATQEQTELFTYRASAAQLLPDDWRKEVATITLSLRGSGESSYELHALAQGCSITVALNGGWSETIEDTSYTGRVPLTAFRSRENTLEVTTQSVKADAPFRQWSVTLYKRWWGDVGFEPLAHLEADQPAMGFSKHTTLTIESVPALKPLTEEPVKSLSGVDEQAIRDVVGQLHTAYQTGNTEAVLALEGVALKNMWEQYGLSSERQKDILKSTTEDLKQAFRSSWKLAPLPTDLTFTSQEGLIKVSAPQALIDGAFMTEEPITSGSTHQTIQSQGQLKRKVLYFAKKNGRWEMVKFEF